MPEGQFLDRETIEYYLCSNGQEKVRKKFVFLLATVSCIELSFCTTDSL